MSETPYPGGVRIHGNGFIQMPWINDPFGRRIHIWHPDLKHCRQSISTDLHDHRWDFESRVLLGTLINVEYKVTVAHEDEGRWHMYTATGPRKSNGNRELVHNKHTYHAVESSRSVHQPGKLDGGYYMKAGVFHRSLPVIDEHNPDPVVTIIKKGLAHAQPGRVMCAKREEPDQEFSRYGVDWAYVSAIIDDAISQVPMPWPA